MRLHLPLLFSLPVLLWIDAVQAQERPPVGIGAQSATNSIPRREVCAVTEKDYPVASLRAKEQGATRLRFTVSAAGELMAVSVLRSSGFPRLDHAAEQVLKTCVLPIKKGADGAPIEASYSVEFTWRIE